MTNKEIWEHFQNLDKEVAEMTKHIEWEKMSSAERFAVECPQGIWHYDEDETEEDSMDKADQWYDEYQDSLASEDK